MPSRKHKFNRYRNRKKKWLVNERRSLMVSEELIQYRLCKSVKIFEKLGNILKIHSNQNESTSGGSNLTQDSVKLGKLSSNVGNCTN